MSIPNELKRVVIKEELLRLTGDMFRAIILNQFIYWSQRVRDVDRFISEEQKRMEQEASELNIKPTNGWIYKTADELLEETMLGISRQSVNRYVSTLVEQGYLMCRNNPDHKWDRTKQYRVDFVKVRHDLAVLGYTLDGYAMLSVSNASLTESIGELNLSEGTPNLSEGALTESDRMVRNERAIPEITTELSIVANKSIVEHTDRTCSGIDDLNGERSKLGGTPDPYDAVDFCMRKHANDLYAAKKRDYEAINELLENGIPLNFILAGIDYTFTQYPTKKINTFVYCARVIKERWEVETAKRIWPENLMSEEQQTDFPNKSPAQRSKRTQSPKRDERYKAFYELFPDS